jgi:hypothetical protein
MILRETDKRRVSEASKLLAKAETKLKGIDLRGYRSDPDVKQRLSDARNATGKASEGLARLSR